MRVCKLQMQGVCYFLVSRPSEGWSEHRCLYGAVPWGQLHGAVLWGQLHGGQAVLWRQLHGGNSKGEAPFSSLSVTCTGAGDAALRCLTQTLK